MATSDREGSGGRVPRRAAGLLAAAASVLCGRPASAFVAPSRAAAPSSRGHSPRRRPPLRSAMTNSTGGMVLSRGGGRLLDEAFSSLDQGDKYETVLAGLCAKVVDGGPGDAGAGLVDVVRLVEEMNSAGITAGPRGAIGLVDATALTSDARVMANVLSLTIKNRAIARYGNLQGNVSPFPWTPTAFGREEQRLRSLPPVPDDDRAAEVSQAAAFSAALAACVSFNLLGGLLGLEDFTFWTNLLIGGAVATVVVDNFFDAIVMGGSAVAKMNEGRLPDAAKNVNAPRKEDMPLGLGTGSMTGSVVRGLGRLLADNTERDCQCEAAAVYAAYGLGLPCFAFQPNSLEGAALVIESMGGSPGEGELDPRGAMDSLASDAGLLKVLIWLMAPVAMELGRHPQLLSSEPREALGLLEKLAERSGDYGQLALCLPENEEQRDAYLRWALAEADLLLRSDARTVEALSEALAGGAATAGDCVAILEGW